MTQRYRLRDVARSMRDKIGRDHCGRILTRSHRKARQDVVYRVHVEVEVQF